MIAQLALLDAWFPSVMPVLSAPRPFATISFAAHFFERDWSLEEPLHHRSRLGLAGRFVQLRARLRRMSAGTALTFVTWNVLATAYIRASYYPGTEARFLDARWRVPALVKRARAFGADLLCLQEVEPDVFDALRAGLAELGYAGAYARKNGKPDGSATFFRVERLSLIEARRIEYRDGSGHIGQLATFDRKGSRVAVLNTHLKWDPPGTPPALQYGFRQASDIIVALQSEVASDAAQIVCGDFNVTPDSDVVRALRAAGFADAHRDMTDIATCNSNGVAKLIDYVFSRGALRAAPIRPLAIEDATPLPSDEVPSDHVPLEVRFE